MKHAIEAVNEREEMAVEVANSNTLEPSEDLARSLTSRETKAAQDTALAFFLGVRRAK